MRPLLNCMQSSCYKVSKIAAKFLKENFQLETRHNIRNNLEPIEGLNKQKIKSNEKLISLDITNMFGEIPKKKPLLKPLRFNSYYGHQFHGIIL